MNTALFGPQDAAALLDWFHQEGKTWPWSGKVGPYAVWVSEVMLQQTTVTAVAPRYHRWMERFPTLDSLAAAEEEAVLREWEGLGYYNRARNLWAAARLVVGDHGGRIPNDPEVLRTLPGVGDYTASALASMAYGVRTAALDANGRRIFQRLTAKKSWDRDLERGVRRALEAVMPSERPGDVNAALMQLGQRVCIPRSPRCGRCPLEARCRAAALHLQDSIPAGRRGRSDAFETRLMLLLSGGRVLMERRSSGMGRGLWVFPPLPEGGAPGTFLGKLPERVHVYTRFRETLVPELYLAAEAENGREGRSWISLKGLEHRPMPSAYRSIALDLAVFLEEGGKT